MANPPTGRTSLSRHEYFLKTDADYRSNYATAVLLKMAKLVEVLALRNGLSFDENGELQGLKKGEAEKLIAPAIDRDEVREASPEHNYSERVEAPGFDPLAASADPAVTYGSEAVGDEPVSDGYLIGHSPQETEAESSEDEESDEGTKESKEDEEE